MAASSPSSPCLFLPFLAFAHLSYCRMDLGCEVNEVICICPKPFAVDCFEERTTGRGKGTTLLPECRKFTFSEIHIFLSVRKIKIKKSHVTLSEMILSLT